MSGVALLCIQAMPLGTLRSQGRALLVHSSENKLTLDFARRFLEANDNAQLLDILAPSGARPKTIVLKELAKVYASARLAEGHAEGESVTVYHFTNYGTNANVDIYPLPAFMVDFLREAQALQSWRSLVAHYWHVGKKGEGGEGRNYLYEQVFDLPDNAGQFVRRFLLGRVRHHEHKAPRAAWDLVDLFLRKVMDMPESRIETIRTVAQSLADYISETAKDARLFRRLFYCSDFRELRWLLLRADEATARKGQALPVTFDQFVEAFGISEDLARPDWRLGWDLTLLRLTELLEDRGFFKRQDVQDELGQVDDDEPELVGAPEE